MQGLPGKHGAWGEGDFHSNGDTTLVSHRNFGDRNHVSLPRDAMAARWAAINFISILL